MALTNYKPKVVIVYTSITGNTEALATSIYTLLKKRCKVEIYSIYQFNMSLLEQFDGIILGTYTWGDGEVPKEMKSIYYHLENINKKSTVTGVFGTGDHFYPNFCGAVDWFRDMLYVHTTLAATLKVELIPQPNDMERCNRFVEAILNRIYENKLGYTI